MTGIISNVEAQDGTGLVNPGDHKQIEFTLTKPVGVEKGMRFAIREGSKTVGAGIVTTVT